MARRDSQTEKWIRALSESTTAGIWRIKRAKIVLGLWNGLSVDDMVLKVRVPPESVAKCRDGFAAEGMAYFTEPTRQPTAREARVERLLEFLNDPPHPRAKRWS
ncbi:MAG: hypothetical protein GY701_13860, partial [Sulfitobacter sp.]|nr:hypothetical protein [Sulfitobacter sp.]